MKYSVQKRRACFVRRSITPCIFYGVLGLLLAGAAAHAGQHLLEVPLPPAADADQYQAMGYSQETWFGSTFWRGPGWARIGRNWQHPGEKLPSVRTFIAPEAGPVVVSGRVCKADTNKGGGDGVRACIRHNEHSLWEIEIDGDDEAGKEHALSLTLAKGDTLRFVIHQRKAIAHDTTYWDPLITYVDGPRFQASEGFTSHLDETAPWRYHHEQGASTEAAPASITMLTHALLLDRCPLAAHPCRFDGARYLPLAVLSAAGDTGGMVLIPDESQGAWRFEAALPDGATAAVISWQGAGAPPTSRAYSGSWVQAFASADSPALHAAYRQKLASMPGPAMDLDLYLLVMEAWLREDGHPANPEALRAAAKTHLDRAAQLVLTLESCASDSADDLRKRLLDLRSASKMARNAPPQAERIYVQARTLKRAALLGRPEFNLDSLLLTKRVPASYSHLVMQYYGFRARPGGGLFILDRPGYSLAATDILDGALESGSVLEPSLDYAGENLVFSYVENAGKPYDPATLDNTRDEGFFHLYTLNLKTKALRQITRGPYDDLMPTWLPDGGVMFCSTRRRGYARCFGAQFSPRWDSYTLHRVEADGAALTTLSYNDVSEWFPTVANDGMILYSRWDYIDRDAVTHQNLWITRPDGSNPAALWGNALPSPHCTFQIKAIPDSSQILFVASAHHSVTGGSLVRLDPGQGENAVGAMTRLTPEIPFPEAESREIQEWYAAPWPLTEDLFLTAYSPWPLVWEPGANRRNALGTYLLDDQGNRELIYRDPAIGATNPIPLRPRKTPPVIPSNCDPALGEEAVFYVADVYDGLKGVVERGAVKALRVVQIFPKSTPVANTPPIGLAGEENARAILGTAPVAEDGSAHFRAPARKALLFQLLDASGAAVQTMRSLTYAQPGERVSCVGCHEGRAKASPARTTLAGRRPPDPIHAGPLEGAPFSFVTQVQPILDQHCIRCHAGEDAPKGKDLTGAPEKGFSRAYWALCGDIPFKGKGGSTPENAQQALTPRYWQRNQVQMTEPGGLIGARGSRLMKMLCEGHSHVRLSTTELARIAAWIDMNAIFYGDNRPTQQALQLAGKTLPMPELQ